MSFMVFLSVKNLISFFIVIIINISVNYCVDNINDNASLLKHDQSIIYNDYKVQEMLPDEPKDVKFQFPFIVYILYSVNGIAKRSCTGSLIQVNFILTAGSCIETGAKPEDFNVQVGRAQGNISAKTYEVEKIFVNPKLQRDSKGAVFHDTALLKLSQNVVLNEYVNTVDLDVGQQLNSTDLLIHLMHQCISIAFGRINLTDENVSLRYQIVYIQRPPVCFEQVPFNQYYCLCIIYPGKKSVCSGDLGGPLVCNGIQYGVSSYGPNEECGSWNSIKVFTKTDDSCSFITNVTGISVECRARSLDMSYLKYVYFLIFLIFLSY